ncbi:MAG: hypothetical protein HC814_04660 [Rhodobacteraceae bacterium]|nr:hypothetical protein [Paracoccaceae bacterium]
MPQFAYRARRRSGELVEGTLEVPDRGAALMQIERLGLFPVMVDGAARHRSGIGIRAVAVCFASSGSAFHDAETQPQDAGIGDLHPADGKPAQIRHALTVALNSMTHLDSKGIPPEVAKQLRQDVMEGRSLSDAMTRQPVVFTDMYVNMVRAGEQSGALVEVLQRLSSHYNRFAECSPNSSRP